MAAATANTATEFRPTRAMLRRLPTLGRNALKALHYELTGEKVFGLRDEILEKTEEALRDALGIED